MNRLLACATVLFAVALAAPATRAHVGGESFIHVPLAHVLPGETFPIVAADLGSGARISLRLVQGERQLDLGAEVAAADGHFQTTRLLPADFPNGYTQLIGSSDDGSEVSTWILVGPPDNAPPLPGGASDGEWWLDPSVLILAAFLAIVGVALAIVAFRTGRRERGPTPAAARVVPRKSSAKARRRR